MICGDLTFVLITVHTTKDESIDGVESDGRDSHSELIIIDQDGNELHRKILQFDFIQRQIAESALKQSEFPEPIMKRILKVENNKVRLCDSKNMAVIIGIPQEI